MAEITLGNKQYTITRSKFRNWIELEEVREKIFHAIEAEDTDEVGGYILLYISTALKINVENIESIPWKDIASTYSILVSENYNIKLLQFMKYNRKRIDDERDMWDYSGRNWYSYSHKIANEYKWNLEYIAELDVDDAFALIQEILVSEQLNREWEWSLSDKSVGYDENTKKSKFIELPRPDWMKPVPKTPKKLKMPKSMMPQGNVFRLNEKGHLENVTY